MSDTPTTVKVWECKGELSWSYTTDPEMDDQRIEKQDAEDYAMELLYEELSNLVLRGDWEDFKMYFSMKANCVDEVDIDE